MKPTLSADSTKRQWIASVLPYVTVPMILWLLHRAGLLNELASLGFAGVLALLTALAIGHRDERIRRRFWAATLCFALATAMFIYSKHM
jgi:hypothetical protein